MENFILFVLIERTNGRVEIFEVSRGKGIIYVTVSLRTEQEGTWNTLFLVTEDSLF